MSTIKESQEEMSEEQNEIGVDDPSSSELSDPPSSFEDEEDLAMDPPSKPPKTTKPSRRQVETESEDSDSSRSDSPIPDLPTMPQHVNTEQDFRCEERDKHELGVFCHKCSAVKMPWGNQLPYIAADDKRVNNGRGKAGSIVAGVHLGDRESIAVLSVAVYLLVNGQQMDSVSGLTTSLEKYPASAAAAQRIVDLLGTLTSLVGNAENKNEIEVPKWYSIVHSVFEEPHLSLEEHNERIFSIISQGGHLSNRPTNYTDKTTQATILTLHGHRRDTCIEEEALPDELSNMDMVLSQRLGRRSTSAGHKGKTPTSESEDDEGSDDEDMVFQPMKPSPAKNAPAGKGVQWAFYKNQDFTSAKRGQPDATKFFMIRQDVNDPYKFDIRQYPNWEQFDWDDPMDIIALNKARDQWRSRTKGTNPKLRLSWTEAEKKVLKNLVQLELAVPGIKDATGINWQRVANDINYHFQGLTQKAGKPLARSSKLNAKGEVKVLRKKLETLGEDRVGSADRTSRCVRIQSGKYADIQKLIDDKFPPKTKKRARTGEKGTKATTVTQDDSDNIADSDDLNEADNEDDEGESVQKKPRLGGVRVAK